MRSRSPRPRLVMSLVAGLANLIPAAGATRIDPIRALRSE